MILLCAHVQEKEGQPTKESVNKFSRKVMRKKVMFLTNLFRKGTLEWIVSDEPIPGGIRRNFLFIFF